jgi:hypothetical protein
MHPWMEEEPSYYSHADGERKKRKTLQYIFKLGKA